MNCNDVRDNLSLYIDDELSEEEKKLIEEHLKRCPECSKELEEYKKLIQMLNDLPDEEPPVGYCKRLHQKLLNESVLESDGKADKITKMPEKSRKNKFKWVKFAGLAASLTLVLLVYGLNNSPLKNKLSEEKSYDMAEAPAEVAPMEPSGAPMTVTDGGSYEYSVSEAENKADSMGLRGEGATEQIGLMAADQKELKIVKTGNLYVQTKDYNKFMDELTFKVEELGGFIENNSTEVYGVYNNEKLMHGNLRIRVPQNTFYETIAFLEKSSDIRNKRINESDVTKEYYEKDNKVKNLETQEEHLRDLFAKATTVEEMLQIENELRRIRTEIDALNISLADIDDRAAMSTISLEIDEIKDVNFTIKSEKGVWERAKEGFISTVNEIVRGVGNLVVSVVASSPLLIPAIIIFVILLSKVKKYLKKKL